MTVLIYGRPCLFCFSLRSEVSLIQKRALSMILGQNVFLNKKAVK